MEFEIFRRHIFFKAYLRNYTLTDLGWEKTNPESYGIFNETKSVGRRVL